MKQPILNSEPMPAVSISLCMIVKNEAEWITRSLDAVRPIVSDMIVLDTGSTDDTAARATAAGARVIPFTWQDDFAAARNVSLSHATGDWILVLDADELLDAEGRAQIAAWVAAPTAEMAQLLQTNYSHESQLAMWQPNRLTTPEAQGYAGYFEIPLVRLFRNDPGIRFVQPIHEMILPTIRSCVTLPVRLHHYGQVRAEGRTRKREQYYRIVEKKYLANPTDPQLLFEYAVASYELGKSAQAREAFVAAVAGNPDFLPSYCALAQLCSQAGDHAAAEIYCRTVLARDPHHVQATVQLANVLMATDRLAAAGALLAQAQQQFPRHPELLKALGRYYPATGLPKVGMNYLNMALAINPHDAQASQWLTALTAALPAGGA